MYAYSVDGLRRHWRIGQFCTKPYAECHPHDCALSPNSSTLGGPAFTLSVVGSNLLPSSTVQWDGDNLQTTFVSSELVTAAVPATRLSPPGPDAVTVVNPAPGGGTSNSLNFAVPCVIPAPAPPSTQTRARLGAYYFDGWSSPLTNFHFNGRHSDPIRIVNRFPGGRTTANVQSSSNSLWPQLRRDFFVFDWYFNTEVNEPGDDLNSALKITHSLSDRHGSSSPFCMWTRHRSLPDRRTGLRRSMSGWAT